MYAYMVMHLENRISISVSRMVRNAQEHERKEKHMDVIDNEVKEIIGSLHLKELVLQELTNDMYNRLENIKALRKKLEKELGTAVKTVRKE